MNIIIIGNGVSGLMTACELLNLDFIKKISIIGSTKIPSIKVGESTTFTFYEYIEKNFNVCEFVKSSDATVKYGVYYKNWSKNNFLHDFDNFEKNTHYELLANKDPKTHIHDLVKPKLWKFIQKNQVSLEFDNYLHSWHFDAGKFKIFLNNFLKKNNKVSFFDDTIIECKFSFKEKIDYIIGESNEKYIADYFVNCCGDNNLNEKVFKEEYISLSPYLLTNKAIAYPLKYTNKRDQFHPYTVAKTMNYGWRWITPTQSRIGTGYVFSDNHISVDEATNEFLDDIGDKTIEPFLIDFNPKFNKKPFKSNSCTIGMSFGFLEPLDAPGLSHTNSSIKNLVLFLTEYNKLKNESIYIKQKEIIKNCNRLNGVSLLSYQWWCSFILHQYKTCSRNDTQFWIDHKNIKCNFYDQIINSLENIPDHFLKRHEYQMFFKTTAGKDIQWKSKVTQKPFLIEEIETETIHHLDYIQRFYN